MTCVLSKKLKGDRSAGALAFFACCSCDTTRRMDDRAWSHAPSFGANRYLFFSNKRGTSFSNKRGTLFSNKRGTTFFIYVRRTGQMIPLMICCYDVRTVYVATYIRVYAVQQGYC